MQEKIEPKKVLLVEDNELCRRLGERTLSNLGYNVITAEDGLKAIAQFQENSSQICAIFMDFEMPNMDGVDASSAIRMHTEGKEVPIIFNSSSPRPLRIRIEEKRKSLEDDGFLEDGHLVEGIHILEGKKLSIGIITEKFKELGITTGTEREPLKPHNIQQVIEQHNLKDRSVSPPTKR